MIVRILRLCIGLAVLLALSALTLLVWSYGTPHPSSITYGVSFNTPYARELGLDWKEVYTALLDDLGVRHFRLAAHWPMVEPEKGEWNFDELDTQMSLAHERGADVILAVGKRLPRWPECHIPSWASSLSEEERRTELRTYLHRVVTRYKDDPALRAWQVENEPFLGVYAREQCGTLDVSFLDEELALVRSLDPSHPVLVTDSGNLGLWYGAYKRSDLFGTSVYLYLWNEKTGPVRSFLPPMFYQAKRSLMELLYGPKETLLIELSLEPWLGERITETPISTQLERMNETRFEEVIEYARNTRLEKQYLWGAEWWYWLKGQGHPEFWEKARNLFQTP